MLPVQYRQYFDGFYTVKLDEGAEEQVAHWDMCLLYDDTAEASSWVRSAPTAQTPWVDAIVGPQDRALQQQQPQQQQQKPQQQQHQPQQQPQQPPQQQQQLQGDVLQTRLSQDAASFQSPTVPICTTASIATGQTKNGMANMVPDTAAAPLNSSSREKEAEEQVVPQLRRTKRTVAQKRLASSLSQTPGDPAAGRSVRRKLSHPEASATPTANVKEATPSTCEFPLSTGTRNDQPILTAEQSRQGPRLNAVEHDRDEDLFVDLSRSNIKSRLSRLQAPHQ